MKSVDNADCYLLACGVAAAVNYPLWKMSAMAQSGFLNATQAGTTTVGSGAGIGRAVDNIKLLLRAMAPPYKAAPTVILGMTWARSMILFGSDYGRRTMLSSGFDTATSTLLPPLLTSSFVQCVNMPLIRASITMQNPEHKGKAYNQSIFSMARHIAAERGFPALWHGLSAGLAKTVPKYVTSVVIKDILEDRLPKASNKEEFLVRATTKACIAGVAGAVLTNPMDVLRNEMFKTNMSFVDTVRSLNQTSGSAWLKRGMTHNMVAVAVPISTAIFLTDVFMNYKNKISLS